HIPKNQESGLDVGRITSSSEPDTETDQPKPNTPDEDSGNGSESEDDQRDLSAESIGDLNLAALDDLESRFDISQSPERQRQNNRSSRPRKASPSVQVQPQSCPSPSTSHSTIQPPLSRTHSHKSDLTINKSPHEPSGSQLTSPGIGRRDSFRADNSLTLDDIRESFSREMGHEYEGSKKSSFEPSPAFQPEPVPDPDSHHHSPYHQKSILNPSTNLSRLRNILNTKTKSIQSRTPFRSTRMRLTEVADDTTELSGLPANQSNHVNHSQPVQVAASESDTTSHDLTTYPGTRHQNGNSSFSFADRSHRFNGNKLNSFLHNLNGQLSEENQQMVNALAETKEQLVQLQMENQSLRKGVMPANTDADDLPDRSGVLLDHLQGMIDVHDSIAELQSNFKPSQGAVTLESHTDSSASNLLSERQIRRLENQLEERDQEIREIRNQLVKKFPPTSSVLKQNFELKDRIAHLQTELANKEDEVDKLKLHHIDLAGQNASTIFRVARQIAAIKDQSTALIQEKDRTICEMNSKYKQVRRLTGVHGKGLDEQKSIQSKSQPSLNALETVKNDSEAANQHEETRHSPQEKEELRAQVEELQLELSEKDYRIEALGVALKESEDARASLESEYAKLETQVDLLESETIKDQAAITGLEVKLSQALKSTFSDVSYTPSRASPKGGSTQNNSELSRAREEINHLKGLLSQSNNAATCEIQTVKIRALEAHRRELEERVGSLRQQTTALISTPSRSSCHFQSIISMRTPKTPGKMLGNMTSILEGDSGDETIVPMLNQINELQQQVEQLRHQLDLANKNVDRKLVQLAEASESAVKMSSDAITAQRRADDLEEKTLQLGDRLDKLIAENGTIAQLKHRLSNIACPDCGERFDANEIIRFRVLPETQEMEFTEPPTEHDTEDHSSSLKAKFTELEASHQTSQSELVKLKRELDLKLDEIEELENEKANHDQEIEQLRNQLSNTQGEVERLLSKSKEEQKRLQDIKNERDNLSNDKDDLEGQLADVNHQLRETQAQLSQVTEARDSMDAEVRALHKYNKDSSASSEQIDQLQKTISKLETEKLELAEQHASMTAEVRQLKNELERKVHMALNSEKSYHRIQATLEKQTVEVGRMQNEIENKQMEILGLNGANSNLVKDTKALRKELIKVKSDAQDLGHHLQELKDHVNRQSAVQTNTKEANKIKNELLACKKELNELRSQQSHRNLGITDETRQELEQKHNSESKGLLLRIRFLKLMFTRESLFRADLACQKKLIMMRLRDTEIRNEAIQLALANFGLPYSLSSGSDSHEEHDHQHPGNFTLHPTSTDRTFKSIAIAVKAVCKLK
ncbi:hypothetical protein PCANC_16620, partial [Puccinia coronata f. sp. avenae]